MHKERRSCLWIEIITDTKFFEFLRSIDDDLAEAVRREGCVFCEGPLHQANYTRKPRGGYELDGSIRRSFCCGRKGCRRRHLPPSVLYLGRGVYYGVVRERLLAGFLLCHPALRT